MEKNTFIELAENYNLIPVYKVIPGDLITPLAAYLKLKKDGETSFLFESVEGIGRISRYSFIGIKPFEQIFNYGSELISDLKGNKVKKNKSIFEYIKERLSSIKYPKIVNLPDFTGGYVGFIGFENISLIEDSIKFINPDELNIPDSIIAGFDTLIVFDHYKHQILLIKNVNSDNSKDYQKLFNTADTELNEIRAKLSNGKLPSLKFRASEEMNTSISDEYYMNIVEQAKQNIYNGDIFQIVLSNRFETGYEGTPVQVYRALRNINPSPYMYYIETDQNYTIIGSSPEDLVKSIDGTVSILPIAGTRKRGKDEAEDKKFEHDLLNDPKELAEHAMLVDLARNDLGRICENGSIKAVELKTVRKYSHVMHIVSRIEGRLKNESSQVDAFCAAFPAGTVSGAPKIRAIQLINEYEKFQRKIYAGAVGYFGFNGNMDFCIAIRTLFADNKKIYWQAGAGIVSDSIPENELNEIYNKSEALKKSIFFAGEIDESPVN